MSAKITKRVYHQERGHGNEDWIYLDYDPESREFTVRQGHSYWISKTRSFKGEEKIYTVSQFLEEFPEREQRIKEEIAQIEASRP